MEITVKHVCFFLLSFIVTWEGTGIQKSQIQTNNVTINNTLALLCRAEIPPNPRRRTGLHVYTCVHVRVHLCVCLPTRLFINTLLILKLKGTAPTPEGNWK